MANLLWLGTRSSLYRMLRETAKAFREGLPVAQSGRQEVAPLSVEMKVVDSNMRLACDQLCKH